MMSNWNDAGSKSISQVICFLNGDQFYGPGTADFTDEEILKAVKDNHIDYYLFYYNNDAARSRVLASPISQSANKLYDDLYPGILVARFQ